MQNSLLYRDANVSIDPIEHFAKALYFDAWRECEFLVATTVYADASGNDRSEPLGLVAGWWNTVDNGLSSAENGRRFSSDVAFHICIRLVITNGNVILSIVHLF